MTQDTERSDGGRTGTMIREPETAAPAPKRPQLVRWIEFLAFLTLLGAAAVVLWFVADPNATDDGIGQVPSGVAIDINEFAALEDTVQPSTGPTLDPVWSTGFQRLAETVGITTLIDTSPLTTAELQGLKDFALLEDRVFVPPTVPELRALAELYDGITFGPLPDNYWEIQRLEELAQIYDGIYFGDVPIDWEGIAVP